MLVIRNAQMHALGEARWRSFKARLAAHVREVLPTQSAELGSDGLTSAIDRHLAAAAQRELTSEYDLTRYVDLMIALGTEPDWIEAMLSETELTPSDRLSWVYARLPTQAPELIDLAARWGV